MSSDAGGAPPARKTVAALADLPLRRGKWTTDEQNYSELLIQYFLAGVVPDCADGTTLRAFLSARLHCAPMRITKKFAGATLGKSIFYRTGHLDEPELWRLRRLESLFVRAEETTSAEAIFFAMRGAAQRSGEVVEHPGPGAGRAARAARRGAVVDGEAPAPAPPRPRAAVAPPRPPAPAAPGDRPRAITLSKLGAPPGAPPDDPNAGTVAQSALHAANAAVRGGPPRSAPAAAGPGPSSSWAARVAEGAALVTAARRDAELRAARANYSADLRTLVGQGGDTPRTLETDRRALASPEAPPHRAGAFPRPEPPAGYRPGDNQTADEVARAAVRAAEAAARTATELTEFEERPSERRRQILMRAIDKIGEMAHACDADAAATGRGGAAARDARTEALRSVSAASAGQSGAVLAAARSAAAVKPATELYSELYGWVPPDLGVEASPATVTRRLGIADQPRARAARLAEPPPFDAATQRGLHGHERGPGGHESLRRAAGAAALARARGAVASLAAPRGLPPPAPRTDALAAAPAPAPGDDRGAPPAPLGSPSPKRNYRDLLAEHHRAAAAAARRTGDALGGHALGGLYGTLPPRDGDDRAKRLRAAADAPTDAPPAAAPAAAARDQARRALLPPGASPLLGLSYRKLVVGSTTPQSEPRSLVHNTAANTGSNS